MAGTPTAMPFIQNKVWYAIPVWKALILLSQTHSPTRTITHFLFLGEGFLNLSTVDVWRQTGLCCKCPSRALRTFRSTPGL